MRNSKAEHVKEFFREQARAQDRDHMRSRRCKVKDLFKDDFLNVGYADRVDEQRGQVVVRFDKGGAPRLRYLKSFVVVRKTAREELGTNAHKWECTFDEFIKDSRYYTQSSDIQAVSYTRGEAPGYDYVCCGSVSLAMYASLKDALAKGLHPMLLIFENYPPKDFFLNMSRFIMRNVDDPLLNYDKPIVLDDWNPVPLEYNPENPTGIADTLMATLEKENCCILQGPPGTGKSYTIAQIIASYLKEGKSVCSTTMTNKGLVELCSQEPLKESIESGVVYKTRLTADEKKKIPGVEFTDNKICPAKGHLLCTTNYLLSGVFSDKYQGDDDDIDGMFDLLVIEEASQTFYTTINAFRRLGNHCLIVGDPRQMPPIVSGQNNPLLYVEDQVRESRGLEAFAIAAGAKSFVVTTSFRLTERSAALTSIFYGNTKLKSVPVERPFFPGCPENLFPAQGGSLFYCTDNSSNPILTETASRLIGDVIKNLENACPEDEEKRFDLAIICPFKDSVKAIQRRYQNADRKVSLTIETVDRVQGMTVDYCILYLPSYYAAFALEEHRFNVATSRSRSTTLIISDTNLSQIYKFKGLVKQYITNCERLG